MRLPFVRKANTSRILNKRRRSEKTSVSFLPFTKAGVHLGDTGASHFIRSETITCGREFLRSASILLYYYKTYYHTTTIKKIVCCILDR
jgi:hypothetical protein